VIILTFISSYLWCTVLFYLRSKIWHFSISLTGQFLFLIIATCSNIPGLSLIQINSSGELGEISINEVIRLQEEYISQEVNLTFTGTFYPGGRSNKPLEFARIAAGPFSQSLTIEAPDISANGFLNPSIVARFRTTIGTGDRGSFSISITASLKLTMDPTVSSQLNRPGDNNLRGAVSG
jgi:hypothetical protein